MSLFPSEQLVISCKQELNTLSLLSPNFQLMSQIISNRWSLRRVVFQGEMTITVAGKISCFRLEFCIVFLICMVGTKSREGLLCQETFFA